MTPTEAEEASLHLVTRQVHDKWASLSVPIRVDPTVVSRARETGSLRGKHSRLMTKEECAYVHACQKLSRGRISLSPGSLQSKVMIRSIA